jgi:hypothetical protein
MSLDAIIPEIEAFVLKNRDTLRALRIFLITHNQWLRVYNGGFEKYDKSADLQFVRRLGLHRGEILDFFAKLEFLVNELIPARFLGLFSEKAYEFDDLLESMNFHERIRLLKQWGIIDNNLMKRMRAIFAVRNQLAHRWNEKEAYYKEDTNGKKVRLGENFEKFKTDGESIWLDVIDKFMAEEEKDIERLIIKLHDPNTINIWADLTKQRERQDSE